MKPTNMILAVIALFTTLSVTFAFAGNRQAGSFAVSGVWGGIVGNGLERQSGRADQQLHFAAHSVRYDRSHRLAPRYNYRFVPRYHYYREHCRQVVILRDGRYGTRRVLTTVCGDYSRYPYDDHYRYRYHDRSYR